MKKVVRLLLAILMVACLALTVTACKNECAKGNHDFSVLEKTDEATCTTPKTTLQKRGLRKATSTFTRVRAATLTWTKRTILPLK